MGLVGVTGEGLGVDFNFGSAAKKPSMLVPLQAVNKPSREANRLVRITVAYFLGNTVEPIENSIETITMSERFTSSTRLAQRNPFRVDSFNEK
jgi:hypothetical protein